MRDEGAKGRRGGGLALVLLLVACARPAAPPAGAAGPVEAVQAFADAIEKGNAPAAWAMLSARTQREADALAATISDAGPGGGRQMLMGSALPGGKITARKIAQDGGAAEVAVSEADAGPRTFRAVREGEVWKVDLDLH